MSRCTPGNLEDFSPRGALGFIHLLNLRALEGQVYVWVLQRAEVEQRRGCDLVAFLGSLAVSLLRSDC